MKVENWSKSVSFEPVMVEKPCSIERLQEVVVEASRSKKKIRVIGSGHSFTPLIETSDILVSLDHLKGAQKTNSSDVFAVMAGTKLWDLGKKLSDFGRAQENLGDIDVQSLAGAISTGTHGTGLDFGVISTQAEWIKILLANGELKVFDRNKDSAEFCAAAVSLGSLGIIVEIGLRTIPAYGLECRQFTENLDEAVSLFEQRCREHRHYEFFWFPHTQKVLSKLTDIAAAPWNSSSKISRFLGDVVLENGVFESINQFVRLFPSKAPRACQLLAYLSEIAGSKVVRGPSSQVFSTQRLSRFQEMEYGLELSKLEVAIEKINSFIRNQKISVSFPIEVRSVKKDNLWLSPAYERDTVFIAVHMHYSLPYREYFEGVEKIFLELGGRPHWGKMHGQNGNTLRSLYPKWIDFLKIRNSLDSDRCFMNQHLERIFGVESG